MGEARRSRIPSGATILGWLGAIGTILGIVGFFIGDLGVFNNEPERLSDAEIIGTLSALQGDKSDAENQLTQIANADIAAANSATQEANAQRAAELQVILDAIEADQDEVVAAQNAIAAETAAADAVNATATQIANNVLATEQFLAQITPTATPIPTATPSPEPVFDYRTLVNADVFDGQNGRLNFFAEVAQGIPSLTGLIYVWSLDADHDPATGLTINDIGVDMQVIVQFSDGETVGKVVTAIQSDGTVGETFFFTDISITGAVVIAVFDPKKDEFLPTSFDWIAQVEDGGQIYSLFSTSGHLTYSP